MNCKVQRTLHGMDTNQLEVQQAMTEVHDYANGVKNDKVSRIQPSQPPGTLWQCTSHPAPSFWIQEHR